MLGSAVQCSDGATGSISRIVLNPDTNQLEYVVVHRGLFGGHDHCVPAGDIQEATEDTVTLRRTTAELKAMPELEVRVPGLGTPQRSIPENCAALDKTTPINDESGTSLGRFHGVVVDANRQVQRILLAGSSNTDIPIGQVVGCSEVGLIVRLAERAVI